MHDDDCQMTDEFLLQGTSIGNQSSLQEEIISRLASWHHLLAQQLVLGQNDREVELKVELITAVH